MKKEYVKIKFVGNSYSCTECSTEEIGNLGLFLTSDVRCYWPGFKKWALDPNRDFTASNFASLEKEEGYVLIGDQYSEEPDGGPFFKVTIEEFVKILDQWEQFCKTRPKEILITRKNGEIKMEGKD